METFDQYKERLLSYLGDRRELEVQSETHGRLRTLVHSVPAERLTASPDGRWSVAQIVGHLADGEIALGYRIRSALANPGGPIQAYDQNRWAAAMRWDLIPVEDSLERFRVLREWNLSLLQRLSGEEWERYGMHTERGRESVRDMTRLGAGHDLNHTMQVERIARG